MDEFEGGRSGSSTGAVVVSIRFKTVVEKSVLVILSIRFGEWKNSGQKQELQY